MFLSRGPRRLLPFLAAFALCAADPSLIDRHVEAQARAKGIPLAPLADDSAFLRRVTLDLHGRLPSVETVRRFLADPDPAKREKYIASLFPPLPVPGMRFVADQPFLHRWTYFFNDLFRNGELLEEGINTFHDHIYKSLLLNRPYDAFVRELITATAVSTWSSGAANFIARSHVFEGDGYQMNHEDTADEIAINTSRLFLGVSLECISCHDGAAHLEKVNLWLSRQTRAGFWRQASFFGQTYISPVFGRSPQFLVDDSRPGYDLTTRSSLRPPRKPKTDVTPAFLLTGEKLAPGEKPREAYARLLTGHPQFARAAVNLFFTELMGQGFIDSPFEFDLARQDPRHPPPAPWTVQPSHPELLDELAAEFRSRGHDLRWLLRTIVSSRAYQRAVANRSGQAESSFTARAPRRLSAEMLFDAIDQVAGSKPAYKITFSDKKVPTILQTRSPQDVDKSDGALFRVLQAFGQCDRYAIEADRKPTMVQAAMLLNDKLIRQRVALQKESRLAALLAAKTPPEKIVEELYLAALSRPPSARETAAGAELLTAHGEAGAEDLLWVILNRLDFLFY